jgi:hypothetical protein
MKLTRRQLLKNSLLMSASAPLSLGAAWAAEAGHSHTPIHGDIRLYGVDSSTTELGLGLRQQGFSPRYEGRLDPLALTALPSGTLMAGFTDEANVVLLTSQLAGRGRIIALARHEAGKHWLLSHRGAVSEPFAIASGSWQASFGRAYARLALASGRVRHTQQLSMAGTSSGVSELSFLVKV